MNFAALVFCYGSGSFIKTIVATIKISVHSRSAVHNERGKENTNQYENASFHLKAKI